jgi:hypothetical protein
MQRLQAFIDLAVPPVFARTFCIFGFHLLRVLLWAWLTLFPVTGPLPHMSHVLAILCLCLRIFINLN